MWVVLSLLAGILQVLRNAASRALGRDVPHLVNTWARFAGNLPFTATLLLGATLAWGWPELPSRFWLFTAACALTQSLANTCLVAALQLIPFSRAVVLHKLEVAMTPFVGVLLFAQVPSLQGFLGVGLCAAGTIALNAAARPGASLRELLRFDRGSWCACGSALAVVFASFFLKAACEAFAAANLDLAETPRGFLAALHALVHAAWMQALVLTLWLLRRPAANWELVRARWRPMLRLGAAAAACSVCWFWAYSVGFVAYVKAVGQVEVLAAALVSHWWLREAGVARQLPAMALVLAGILLVALG